MSISPVITARESFHLGPNCTGLGNSLFQTSAAYSIAKKSNLHCSYNNIVKYCDILSNNFSYNHKETIFRNFQITSNIPSEKNIINEPPPNTDRLGYVLSLINPTKNNILDSYYEGIEYFDDYKEELQALFSPDEKSLKLLQTVFPFLFDGTNTVGVHFRIDHSHNFMNYEGYKVCINLIKKQLGEDIMFVIFTDNIIKTDFSLFNNCKYTIIHTTYDYLDMWALSFCKNYILSHSTFAFWGFYLNMSFNGKMTCPSFNVDWYDTITNNIIEGFKTNF